MSPFSFFGASNSRDPVALQIDTDKMFTASREDHLDRALNLVGEAIRLLPRPFVWMKSAPKQEQANKLLRNKIDAAIREVYEAMEKSKPKHFSPFLIQHYKDPDVPAAVRSFRRQNIIRDHLDTLHLIRATLESAKQEYYPERLKDALEHAAHYLIQVREVDEELQEFEARKQLTS